MDAIRQTLRGRKIVFMGDSALWLSATTFICLARSVLVAPGTPFKEILSMDNGKTWSDAPKGLTSTNDWGRPNGGKVVLGCAQLGDHFSQALHVCYHVAGRLDMLNHHSWQPVSRASILQSFQLLMPFLNATTDVVQHV